MDGIAVPVQQWKETYCMEQPLVCLQLSLTSVLLRVRILSADKNQLPLAFGELLVYILTTVDQAAESHPSAAQG